MRQLLCVGLLISSISLAAQPSSSSQVISLMGSRFELIAISETKSAQEKAIEQAIEEIKRIENLISSWNPKSETSQINVNAGIAPVKVSQELFRLIERTIKISNLTEGAFDISFSSIDNIWVFDGREMNAPDSAIVKSSVKNINYKNIILNYQDTSVFLVAKGMKISFGAIGKGYAANRAKNIMLQNGIKNGMVNAGGDLISWGSQANGESWQIGIADPTKHTEYVAWLNVSNMSVVTSGNYEKFVIIDQKKYGHIIDPKTGYPVEGIQSVTLISPDAELSDALSTSVFVLGVDRGLLLVNKLKNVECLIIDDQNKIWTSDQLKLNYY